jgi:hypothetical protein
MRNIATFLVIAAAGSLLAMPLARAADRTDSHQTDSQRQVDSHGHVKQHQDAVPRSQARKPESGDQSAQVPQSPAVITPPTTGDKSVITPPATDAAKTPVIKPPGSPGNNGDIKPQ